MQYPPPDLSTASGLHSRGCTHLVLSLQLALEGFQSVGLTAEPEAAASVSVLAAASVSVLAAASVSVLALAASVSVLALAACDDVQMDLPSLSVALS